MGGGKYSDFDEAAVGHFEANTSALEVFSVLSVVNSPLSRLGHPAPADQSAKLLHLGREAMPDGFAAAHFFIHHIIHLNGAELQ